MPIWDAAKTQWWPHHITESAWLEHTPFAAWLVPILEPKTVVELGTHQAVSYMAFCQANVHLAAPAKCFAIDTWQGDEHAGQYDDSIFQHVKNLNQQYDEFSTLLRVKFDDALDNFENGSVDLLHIDGFHTCEAVAHDFHSWLPKMSERGVILFHDTEVRDRNFGVWRLWQELSKRYPHFNFEHGFGLGLLVVGPHAPDKIKRLCQSGDNGNLSQQFRDFFADRGREVIVHYQTLLATEAQKSRLGRYRQTLKTFWRSHVPISIRKRLQSFRSIR